MGLFMTAIVDVYTNAVYNNLRPLRANWDPAQPVALGDFGLLSGEVFQRLGNLSALNVDIGKSIDDDLNQQKIFSSARDMSVSFTGAATVAGNPAATVKASVNISFGSSDSAFFNAADCSYSMIADKAALGTTIMALSDAGKWTREWVVVTDLVKAKATTIVISSAAHASIVLEATGNSPQVDLADANIGLTVKNATNVGYQIIAQHGLTPLIGLSKVQSSFLWWGDGFKPLTDDMLMKPSLARTLQDSTAIRTEPRSYLAFSQLA
jgi:hypothetical protein